MKKRQSIFGVASLAALVLTGLVASSAFAFVKEWYVEKGGVFSKVAAGEKVKVISLGILTLENTKLGIGIKCGGEGEGTVESAGKDTTTAIFEIVGGVRQARLKKCITVKGLCASPEAEAVNTPWKSQLVEVSVKLRDELSSSGVGDPGWLVICGGFSSNLCTAAKGTTAVRNTGLGIEATFDAETENAVCGKEGREGKVGTVRGSVLIEPSEAGVEAIEAL